MKKIIAFSFLILFSSSFSRLDAQYYWQQQADYSIAIDFEVNDHSFRGRQIISYSNNSPDTLDRLFFHQYYNAFRPNSMMDISAQEIPDPNYDLDFKIKYLTSSETGWMKVNQILQNGQQAVLIEKGTLLEAILSQPILPGETVKLEMSFAARVPLLCRRTGRDNAEDIDYTMAQWFPKLCVYDDEGWHPTPYIGREFYSDWGNYDVQIRIDSNYVLAAGADSIISDTIAGSHKKQWHFISKNVLDFSWAADTDYQHHEVVTEDGIRLHFYFQEAQNQENKWIKMAEPLLEIFPYINKKYGKYPYENYSIIQAGDGATEYSKSTFITGERSLGSLVGVSIHEIMHSWFQHLLASQENKYAWMDEGFASFAATEIKQHMREKGIYFGEVEQNPFEQQFKDYLLLVKTGLEEPMSTPANFFNTNLAYNIGSYSKGELFLLQLRYIIGEANFNNSIAKYINEWKFRHPKPADFIRVVEKVSGIELDWYLHYWTRTTHTIDYSVQVDSLNESQSILSLQRIGQIPMPLDVQVIYSDGSEVDFIIPIDLMNGHKAVEEESTQLLMQDWPWIHRIYQIQLNTAIGNIRRVEIDPKLHMADIDRRNNVFE